MRSKNHVIRVLRVRMRLHYTLLFACVLVIVIVATQFPEAYTLWRRLLLGATACFFIGVAIITRQLTINFVAIRRHMWFKSVTLFVFGGIPGIPKEATSPALELLLSVVGLLSSLIIAILFYAIYVVLVITGNVIISGLIQWIVFITLMLTLFHLIPGFPLDGGRILRAILWRATGDYDRAASVACLVGQGIGLFLGVGGIVLLIIAQKLFVGLLLIYIGWVLYLAAAQCKRQAALRKVLHSITVRDVMSPESPFIIPQFSIGQLVRERIAFTGQRYFPVVEDAKLLGIVTIRKIKSVPNKRWDFTPVTEIMTPSSVLDITHPNQSVADLLEQMNELGISEIPVLEGDKMLGVIARDSLYRLAKTRTELGK